MSKFQELVFKFVYGNENKRIIIRDEENLFSGNDCASFFQRKGFYVINYVNDIDFRVEHERDFKENDKKWLIVAEKKAYIPYDIISLCSEFLISYSSVFKKLNSRVLKTYNAINIELLSNKYLEYYGEELGADDTRAYIEEVYTKSNIAKYLPIMYGEIHTLVENAKTYNDWFLIADKLAEADMLAIEYSLTYGCPEAEQRFLEFLLNNYGKLNTCWDKKAPVLVSQAMEYMKNLSGDNKFIIIVMDGMSELDWKILSKSFTGIKYSKYSSMAMIPTVTSISRQCLLSGKLPIKLENPWSLAHEEKEFLACAEEIGFMNSKCKYERGYDAQFKLGIKCGAIIINEIDDTVHGQQQGRAGMFNAINHMASKGKLVSLVKRLIAQEYDVYITADHGNSLCTGLGGKRTGVETVTKSNRMRVLKDYADVDSLREEYDLVEYPGYYLNKNYKYLICNEGVSFDPKDSVVMTHGGMTIEEVIVPFITIKAEENNG